jgi:hypothetical protein
MRSVPQPAIKTRVQFRIYPVPPAPPLDSIITLTPVKRAFSGRQGSGIEDI